MELDKVAPPPALCEISKPNVSHTSADGKDAERPDRVEKYGVSRTVLIYRYGQSGWAARNV